jgi:hypothetical protein
MDDPEVITSVSGLINTPAILRAEILELSLCDAVHFRLLKPGPVFALVERHLMKDSNGRFDGYAAVREQVETRMCGASLKEKVDACCTDRHDWLSHKQILYSTELEVWMDLSYANPWALDLYHKALYLGKALFIPRIGQFTPVFIQYLLQKNGYERLAGERIPGKTVRVVFGRSAPMSLGDVVIDPEVENEPEHALALEEDLASLLANGCILKDREQHLAMGTQENKRHLHELGYRLIGPSLALLIQRLAEEEQPVGFTGAGAEFLTTLAQSAQQRWLWMPEIVPENKASVVYSLLPDPKAGCCLLPDAGREDSRSVIPLEACDPEPIFRKPLGKFIQALLAGQQAEDVQTGAASFVRDYSVITRGLHIKLSVDPILREWRQFILSPSRGFLRAIVDAGIVPGFNPPVYPWQARNQVERGPWPTGSYLLTKRIDRWWMQLTIAERKRTIGEWYERLHSPAAEPVFAR